MPTHVAFLRAINLGRNRKLPMADLRACLTEAGLEDVETYIQTGNVRFRSGMRSRRRVEEYVEGVLATSCGFDVPTIVFTPAELQQVYDDAMSLGPEHSGAARRYVTFLKADPPAEAVAETNDWAADGEHVRVIGRAVHWSLAGPSQQAQFSNARAEKALGVATTRDLKVVRTLAERWGSR